MTNEMSFLPNNIEEIKKPEPSLAELLDQASKIMAGEVVEGKTNEELASDIRLEVEKKYNLAERISSIGSEELMEAQKQLNVAKKLEGLNKEKKAWGSESKIVESKQFENPLRSEQNTPIEINGFCCASNDLYLEGKLVRRINAITVIYSFINSKDKGSGSEISPIIYTLDQEEPIRAKRISLIKVQDELEEKMHQEMFAKGIGERSNEGEYTFFSKQLFNRYSIEDKNLREFVIPNRGGHKIIDLSVIDDGNNTDVIGAKIEEQADEIINSIIKTWDRDIYNVGHKVASVGDGGKRYSR